MAKVYNPPTEIELPVLSFTDIKAYDDACDKYRLALKEWCINRAKIMNVPIDNVGSLIYFPVADGKAEYMVASLKPVELIHLPLGDAWSFQYDNRLTKKDILEKIKQQNDLREFFARKKK